jgi:putative phosphoesterase
LSKIGLISDTHDNIANIEKSVRVFKEQEVNIVIHAGDFVSPGAIRAFREVKLIGVYGNNDVDKAGIKDAFNEIGGQIIGDLYEFEVDGLTIGVYHGTRQDANNGLIDSGKYDVVVCGHTHRIRNITVGKTRVINPGTANGWFFGFGATLAVLHTHTRFADFIRL